MAGREVRRDHGGYKQALLLSYADAFALFPLSLPLRPTFPLHLTCHNVYGESYIFSHAWEQGKGSELRIGCAAGGPSCMYAPQ